jgi:hypothetical protein
MLARLKEKVCKILEHHMRTILLYLRCLFLLLIGLLAYSTSPLIDKSSISGLLDALLSVSGLLFAVFGAWLSLLASNMLSVVNANHSSRTDRDKEVDKAELLVAPMTAAAVMVVIGIVAKFGIVFTKAITVPPCIAFGLKMELVFIMTTAAFYQVWYIIGAVKVGIQFVLSLERLSCDKSSDNR